MKLGTVGVNLGNVETYRAALKGLSVEQSVFALASKGATEEQIRQILVTNQATAEDVEAAMAKAGLTTATQALTQAEMIEMATKTGVAKATAEELLSKIGITATETGQIPVKKQVTRAMLEQAVASGTLTKAEASQIATMLGLNAVETANIGITNVLTASFAKLWAVITAHPIGAILTAIGVVAVGAVAAYNKWGDTLENTKEKLSDLKSECQEIVSDLQAVNSELETTQQRLEELEGKDTLTFTEKEEYDNLVKINNELQRKIDLLELEEKNKRKKQNKTFVSAMEKDTENPFEHEVNPDGKKPAGQYSISDEYLTSETGYINAQFEIREQLLDDLANAETEKEKERIQKRIDEINSYLEDKNTEWKTVSDGIDYIENPTTEDDKAVNEWLDYIADFQDRMAIVMGGDNAKINTFNRLVDNWQFDEIVQGLQDLGTQGKVTAEMLNDPKYDEFINKLVELGVIDSADNLNDIAKAFNGLYSDSYQNLIDLFGQDAVDKLTPEDLEIAYTISSEEADKALEQEKNKIKSELKSLSKEGNVDLTIRPVIDSSAMQAAGWDVEDGSIATTFTQGEFIWQGDEENGQYVYIHYTPILPDGTVLTPNELTDYLYGTLEGSQSVLDADNKGIVLKVDTDLNIPEGDIKKFTNGEGSTDAIDGLIQKTGEWDDKVHGVQEQYYDTGEGIGYASNALNGLIEKHKQLENGNGITVSFEEVFNSSTFSENKEKLLELAMSGEITPEVLESTEEYKSLLTQTGLTAEETMEKINAFASTRLTVNISECEELLEKIRKGQALTAEEASHFINKNSELAGSLLEVSGGFSFEEDAIINLLNSSIEAKNVVVSNQIAQTKEVIEQIKTRIEGYKSEIRAIQNTASAQRIWKQSLNPFYSGSFEEGVDNYSTSEKIKAKNKEILKEEKKLKKSGKKLEQLYKELGELESTDKDKDKSSSSSKQQFDWIERRITTLTNKISKLNAEKENLFSVKKRNKNLNAQIKETTKLINTYSSAYSKYLKKANSISFSKDAKKDSAFKKLIQNGKIKDNYKDLIKEYGEKTAEKIQSYMDWWDKAQESLQSKAEAKTQKRQLEEEKYQYWVNKRNAKAELNDLRASDTSLSAKKRNKYLEKEKKNLKKSYNWQIKIAGLNKDTTEQKRLQKELQLKLVELSKQEFDNIANAYERKIQTIGYEITNLDNKIAEIEASGAKVNRSLYNSKKFQNERNKAQYQAELNALNKKLADGTIKKGSDEWYDALDAIQECKNGISECVQTTYELNNAINELHFEKFNDIADAIDRIISEQDFLQGLFTHEKMVDEETGTFTEAGLSKLALLSGKYYESKEKITNDEAEIKELEKMLNSKELHSDILGITFNSVDDLEARLNEMYDTWQNDINETYQIETEFADMMKDNYQSQLDMLKELIDARKEELQLAKDLRQYNREITEKTDNIALLQRQIAAYGGDSSEEGKSRLQQLQAQLDEARDDLIETENEKMVSDINDMLDKLITEYEELTSKKLDEFQELVQKGLEIGNSNTAIANSYLAAIADHYGYDIKYDDLLKGDIQKNVANYIGGLEKDITAKSGTVTDNSANPTLSDNGWGHVYSKEAAKEMVNSKSENIVSNGNVYDEYTKKKVETIFKSSLYTDAPKKAKKSDYTSSINQFLFEKNKKILTKDGLKALREILGVKNNGILSALQDISKAFGQIRYVGGFKGGGIAQLIKARGEDGIALVRNGEGLIAPEHVPMLKNLLDITPQIYDLTHNLSKLPTIDKNVGSTFNGDISLNLELPNVHNANDFVHELQNNPKLQKALRSVTTDMLAGGGRLSVRNIK